MAGNQKIIVNLPQKVAVKMPERRLIDLLAISGELNFLFYAKQFGLDKGVVLLLDENISRGSFISNLQDTCGAVRVNAPKRNCEKEVWNYQLAVSEYNKYQKWEELASFLDIKKFVPILVVKGIIPDELRDMAYVIEISPEMAKTMGTPEFRMEIGAMIKFIRENPDVVVRELELFRTSEVFLESDNNSQLLKNLLAAMRIYLSFYRSTHTDKETDTVKAEVECEIRNCVQRAEELEEEYDAVDTIRAVINRYFNENNDFEIFSVEEIDEETLKAVRIGKAVLHDTEYYWVCEPLFKRAGGVLMTVLSHIQIKKILRDEGILVCNQTGNTNFTVKKVLVSKNGQSFRERFIKLRKEFFISRDGLYLEERMGDEVYR